MNTVIINQAIYDWDTIVSYMDDDIREQVHGELAPCTEKAFWERYMELDPENEILDIVSPMINTVGIKWKNYDQIDYETLFGEGIDEEQTNKNIKEQVLEEVVRQGGNINEIEYILLSNGGKI